MTSYETDSLVLISSMDRNLSQIEKVAVMTECIRIALSIGPSWIGASLILSPEDGKKSSFQTGVFISE